jgi:hypothetical protein
MSDYRLQVVFEPTDKNAWYRKYRFAVIDPNKVKGYPANLICVFRARMEKSPPKKLNITQLGVP